MFNVRKHLLGTAAVVLGSMALASAGHAADMIVGASVGNGDIFMLTTSEVQGNTGPAVNWSGSDGATFGGFELFGSAESPPSVPYPPNIMLSNSIEAEETSGATAGEVLHVYMTGHDLTIPASGSYIWTTGYGNNSSSTFTVLEQVYVDDSSTDGQLYNSSATAANCPPTGSGETRITCQSGAGYDTGTNSLASGYTMIGAETVAPGAPSTDISQLANETDPYSVTIEYTITLGAPTSGNTLNANVDLTAAVPEPASLSLLGGALLGFGAWSRRRRNRKA
jgi:hypothetical protein